MSVTSWIIIQAEQVIQLFTIGLNLLLVVVASFGINSSFRHLRDLQRRAAVLSNLASHTLRVTHPATLETIHEPIPESDLEAVLAALNRKPGSGR